MDITNYTLKDFINQPKELIAEYLTCLSYINPIKTKNQIMFLKLKEVEQIKQTIGSGIDKDVIDIVGMVQELEPKKVMNLTIIEFFGLFNSIKEQIEVIVRAEERGLAPSHTDVKWEMVRGSERMAKFGIYNTLDNLTGKKPHLYEQYRNMIYSEIFFILRKWKEEGDIQYEMNAIKLK